MNKVSDDEVASDIACEIGRLISRLSSRIQVLTGVEIPSRELLEDSIAVYERHQAERRRRDIPDGVGSLAAKRLEKGLAAPRRAIPEGKPRELNVQLTGALDDIEKLAAALYGDVTDQTCTKVLDAAIGRGIHSLTQDADSTKMR